jgi:hypothetical protein
MPTLSLVLLVKEVPPTRRNVRLKWKSKASSFNAVTRSRSMASYPRAEGKSGVISSENDDAEAIISVKEIIGSDQVIHDWNRNRVAPEFRKFLSL